MNFRNDDVEDLPPPMFVNKAKKMINEILDSSYELNDWEDNFLHSLLKWKGVRLTPRQTRKLMDIHGNI